MDVIGVYIYFVNQANGMVTTCINSYCCTRINHNLVFGVGLFKLSSPFVFSGKFKYRIIGLAGITS